MFSIQTITYIFSQQQISLVDNSFNTAAARRQAMATADSPGSGRQIESNTPAARRTTIE